MKLKPNAAQAGAHAPANEKAPGVAIARGPENTTSKCSDFKQQVEQAQGKRFTVALVADLKLHPAKQLRELSPNRRALMALDLAEAMGYQYVIAAGQLMASNADAFAMTLASDADVGTLTRSVLAAHLRMAEFSDATAWTVMLSNEMRGVVSQALEAAQS